jgi:hypothetical protein
LIFDNYTSTHRPADTLPASSYPKKISVGDDFIGDSSCKDSTQDLRDLRQQLQSMKKQALVIMEQSRKSLEKENIALQQAQDAIAAKEDAVAAAAEASRRENFMLELMLDSSLDMAGILHSLDHNYRFSPCFFLPF